MASISASVSGATKPASSGMGSSGRISPVSAVGQPSSGGRLITISASGLAQNGAQLTRSNEAVSGTLSREIRDSTCSSP